MDKKRNVQCVLVKGNGTNLKRGLLKQKFSSFGKIGKLFVDKECTFAKVYFQDANCIREACEKLNGFSGWQLSLYIDESARLNRTRPDESPRLNQTGHLSINNCVSNKHPALGSQNFDTASICSTNISVDMEEDGYYCEDYVDIHGRSVDVVQSNDGKLFVNLDDVRAAGFNIYPRDSFENAVITKEIELRHLENYLLNQGQKYILKYKQTFNEDEMLSVFERVRAKLQDPTRSENRLSDKRIVSNTSTSNLTITSRSTDETSASRLSFDVTGVPMRVPPNIKPSYTHFKPNTSLQANSSRGKPNGRGSFRNLNATRNISLNETNLFPKISTSTPVSKADPEETWQDDNVMEIESKSKQTDTSSTSTERNLINLERVQLAPGANYKIRVSFIHPEKKGLFYGQLLSDMAQIEEILLHVNTVDNKLPEIMSPVRNTLCVVLFNDIWYRAVVLHERQAPGTAYVELIDYGNKEEIAVPVREMSESMKALPGQAIRCSVHQDQTNYTNFEVDEDLEVFVKKHYHDLTHLVEIKGILKTENIDAQQPTLPSTPVSVSEVKQIAPDCFTQIPPNPTKLTSGEMVMIVNFSENKLVLRNKESAAICSQVYQHLREIKNKSAVTNPKVGQLVLCSRTKDEGLHRAVIKRINGQAAELELIDFYGGETLSLSSLRNFDNKLASLPSAKIEREFPVLAKLTKEGESMLIDFVFNKTKLKTVIDGDKFDLEIIDGQRTKLLSQEILDLANPPPAEPLPKSTPIVSKSPVQEVTQQNGISAATLEDECVSITIDDMAYVKVPLGKGSFSCYCCKDGSVTLISLDDANVEHIIKLGDVEPIDSNPHTPDIYTMCLAKFKDEWYRALVTDIENDKFEVLFVDYGNMENIDKSDLRRFPKKYADIPVLGIGAYFVNIPDNGKVHSRLSELIPDELTIDIDVKVDMTDDNLKYGIEIPSIYETLKKEGLI